MWLSPDDAKTDVILAAATAVFGVAARGFVVSLPLYPRQGVVAVALDVVWIVAITALVPVLLARYRQDGAAAFGLSGTAGGMASGLVLAVPVVAVGVLTQVVVGAPTSVWLLGRLAAPLAVGAPADLALTVARVLALSLGGVLLIAFLAVRGRDGFPRSPEVALAGLVRPLGLAAIGLALVLGVLRALGPGSIVVALVNVLGLAALLLLADRLVPAGITVPRTAVVAPLVVVTVAFVLAAGGIFRGDLAGGLYRAALAAGATIAIAALAQTRRGVWAAVPLVVAAHWWPTCLSPLTLAGGTC